MHPEVLKLLLFKIVCTHLRLFSKSMSKWGGGVGGVPLFPAEDACVRVCAAAPRPQVLTHRCARRSPEPHPAHVAPCRCSPDSSRSRRIFPLKAVWERTELTFITPALPLGGGRVFFSVLLSGVYEFFFFLSIPPILKPRPLRRRPRIRLVKSRGTKQARIRLVEAPSGFALIGWCF